MKINKKTLGIIAAVVIVVIAAVAGFVLLQKPATQSSGGDNMDAINYYNKGNTLAEQGDYKGALSETEKALAINPNFPPAWIQEADTLNHLGRYYDAINATNRVLVMNSTGNETKALALAVRADTLNNLGYYQQAVTASEMALQLDPEQDMAVTTRNYAKSMLAAYANLSKSQ